MKLQKNACDKKSLAYLGDKMVLTTGQTRLIKDLPLEDRPREKMQHLGANALTDGELIAVLLRTGTKDQSALSIGEAMTREGGLYRHLAAITRMEELQRIKGLGEAKAATILAALEIGRRIASAKPVDRVHFTCPRDGADILMPRLRYAQKEQFVVVLLNTKNRVLGIEVVSEGSLNSSVVHPREVFQPAILAHASAIVVAHNHPSGDPQPSPEDVAITDMLKEAGRALAIPVLDHIIIGDGAYYSFKEYGM